MDDVPAIPDRFKFTLKTGRFRNPTEEELVSVRLINRMATRKEFYLQLITEDPELKEHLRPFPNVQLATHLVHLFLEGRILAETIREHFEKTASRWTSAPEKMPELPA